MTPDIINAIFEFTGAVFLAMNCYKLHRDKKVKGIYWPTIAFFATWGLWNLYFYPHLDQTWSFYGGIALVAANITWLGQLAYWWSREREEQRIRDQKHCRAKVVEAASIISEHNEIMDDIPWAEGVKVSRTPLSYWHNTEPCPCYSAPAAIFEAKLGSDGVVIAGVPVKLASRETAEELYARLFR